MKKVGFLFFYSLIASSPFLFAAEQANTPASSSSTSTSSSSSSSSSAIQGIAGGVKKIAYEGPKDFTKETAKGAAKKPPIVNVVEGVNKGTEKFLDHTLKGAYKVATLGRGELSSYEIEEPRKGSDDTTKIKIKIPGT